MLPITYLLEVIKTRLQEIQYGVDLLDHKGIVLSLNKTHDKLLITHQPTHPKYNTDFYIYRRSSDIWVLEHRESIQCPDWLVNYKIDAWLVDNGFVIKLCNISDDTQGVTYHYKDINNQYVLERTTTNSRLEFNDQPFFIEGGY